MSKPERRCSACVDFTSCQIFGHCDHIDPPRPERSAMNKVTKLYLQVGSEDEVTWSWDRINDDDEEYVRLSDLTSGVVEIDGVRYVLVPEEPTKEMMAAGERAVLSGRGCGHCWGEGYRAMIGAKP